jgi:hypothetical protein
LFVLGLLKVWSAGHDCLAALSIRKDLERARARIAAEHEGAADAG